MTIEKLTKLVDGFAKAGEISIDERIEVLDVGEQLGEQISNLSERLNNIPEAEEQSQETENGGE